MFRNGAPLSGALFVSKSNPKRGAARSLAGLKLRTNRKRKGGSRARRNTLLLNLHGNGRKNGRRNARKNAHMSARRNTLLMNLHGNGRKGRGFGRRVLRNTLLMNLHGNRRRGGKKVVRRNALGAFSNQFTAPVEGLARKIPVVGNALAGYVSPILVGVAVGAVHYGAMKGLGMIPGAKNVLRAISPVKFTVQGALVATALNYLPVGSKELRNQVAAGALLVGGALDIYRFLSDKVGDLGDLDLDGDDESEYDGADDEAEYDGLALTDMSGLALTDMSGLALTDNAGFGDGMAYDVVPFAKAGAVDYSGASLADAYYAPADLSVQEGQAALMGPKAWHQTFGDAPVQAINYNGQGVSSLAGRPGHRFGWLICLVGWDRFAKIAALSPEKRVALLDQIKAQAIATVEQQTAAASAATPGAPSEQTTVPASVVTAAPTASTAGETAGLALDMNGLALSSDLGSTLFAGSAF
jgi:hypothetical protein